MGYTMRFIQTDDRPITLAALETALRRADTAYALQDEGNLTFEGALYAQIEVNHPGDGLFEREIEELRQVVEEAKGRSKRRVLETLEQAKAIVAVQVLWQGREAEETLSKIDPLWQWLFSNRKGLVQADGEGYYERTRCILTVE